MVIVIALLACGLPQLHYQSLQLAIDFGGIG
jgi:hypothetical protein